MNPCGIILTYMTRQDWQGKSFWIKLRTIIFNLSLFVGQLFFIVAGTAYGKIKWEEQRKPSLIDAFIVGVFTGLFIIFLHTMWLLIPTIILYAVVGVAMFRNIPWRRVWRAAQCSHVRLCLRRGEDQESVIDMEFVDGHTKIKLTLESWDFINFGIDGAEIKPWRMDQIDGKRFRYFDPTFPTPPEFMEPVIQYAEDQVGKKYDELQLISSGLHLIAWIVMPWSWGKELKIIKAFNRKGGREHCISGLTACLRNAERPQIMCIRGCGLCRNDRLTNFFRGYSTATTFPCQIAIDENWREREN